MRHRFAHCSVLQSIRINTLLGLLAAGIVWHCTAATVVWAQAKSPAGETDSAKWPLEEIKLKNGNTYLGLVESEEVGSVEFVEVRRAAGKPVNLVIRQIDRMDINSWQRLDPKERRVLSERVDRIKNRAVIEARRMKESYLVPIRRNGTFFWQYDGSWFSLESTADQDTTSRAIVRLEQVFTAYRQMLPPRLQSSKRLQVLLFGDSNQYRAHLRTLGLDITNPAVFAANLNLIVAGSDTERFRDELAKVRRQHNRVIDDLDEQIAAGPKRRKTLREQLKAGGFPEDQIQTVLLAEQKKWEALKADYQKKIKALDRINAARFNEVAGQMLVRLFHEAFHAYLENYNYPRGEFNVPRWLNEGLAQTFEGGMLEADSLRVDAPNARALVQLQNDLRGPAPLPLSEVLTSSAATFLADHRGGNTASARLYLYSWGLAHYLTFEQSILGSAKFEEYLAASNSDTDPVERFEQLVGQPLSDFEKKWRAAMLALPARTIATAALGR